MGNILSRIQEIALNEGITIGAMERKIGASKGVLSRAINNGTDIQAKWIQVIVENYPQYSTNWLITGKEPMLRKKENTSINTSIPSEGETISIPMIDISAAAGCGGCDNSDYLEIVDSIKLPTFMVNKHAQYFCVRVKGESMSPTILDSSYIIVRLLERNEWENLPEKHVFVISDYEGRTYVKRLKNRFRERGFVVCMSDNVDKANYPNFNLMENEINTILHAEWYISAKMPNLNETYYKKIGEMDDRIDSLESKMSMIIKGTISNK